MTTGTCKKCGKEFKFPPCQKAKYCSWECYSESRTLKGPPCKHCGSINTGRHQKYETRKGFRWIYSCYDCDHTFSIAPVRDEIKLDPTLSFYMTYDVKCPQCGYEFKSNTKSGVTSCSKCKKKIVIDRELRKRYKKEWRKKHGEQGAGYERTYLRRKRLQVLEDLGGKCLLCDYSKSLDVLDIHHRGGTKEHENKLKKYPLEKLLALCPTCHRETHLGLTRLSSEIKFGNKFKYLREVIEKESRSYH